MKKGVKYSLFSLAACLILVGCGGGSSSNSSSSTSSTTTNKTSTLNGSAIDGPIAYAKVCLDLNFNEKCDDNEPFSNTDANGNFSFSYNPADENATIAPVLVEPTDNSIDIYTKESFVNKLSTPRTGENTVYVSPISTIATKKVYVKTKTNKITETEIKEIKEKVSKALNLEEDITNINPIKDKKNLAVSVFLSKLAEENPDVIEVVSDKIINENKSIEEAIPKEHQTVFNNIITSVENNELNDPVILQQAVEVSIDTNENIVEKINDTQTEVDLAKVLIGGYLKGIFNDFKTYDLAGLNDIKVNLDLNPEDIAESIYNTYSIKNISSLNEAVNEKEINVKINESEIKINQIINTYEKFKKIKKVFDELNILHAENIGDINKKYYFDVVKGKQLFLPHKDYQAFMFKENNITQSIYMSDENYVAITNNEIFNKVFVIEDNNINAYFPILISDSNNLDDIKLVLSYKVIDNNSIKDRYLIDGKIYEIDSNKIKDGILELDSDNYFIATKITDDYSILNGYIVKLENGKVISVKTATMVYSISEVEKFLDSLPFKPIPITLSDIAGKKIILDNIFTAYFTSNKKVFFHNEDDYDIINNVLVIYNASTNINVMVAFKSLNDSNGEISFYDFKDEKLFENMEVRVESFDEATFNPYPTYVINNSQVMLKNDDDKLNLNQNDELQFNIVDDNGTGIQCTTNFNSLEEFKNAFDGNELILDAAENEINCLYLVGYNVSLTDKQTEIIKFIDNNDGSYQIHLITGYFSGTYEENNETKEFNITAIDDNIVFFEDENFENESVENEENQTNTNSSIEVEPLTNLWGYDWVKILAMYPGDERFKDNDVVIYDENEYIVLRAYKKDKIDSMAEIATNLNYASGFNIKVNLENESSNSNFGALGIAKGYIKTNGNVGNLKRDENLTFIAGIKVYENSISSWVYLNDSEGNEYYQTIKTQDYSEDLNNLNSDGNDVMIEIKEENGSIHYVVTNDNSGDVIFDSIVNLKDLNITNFEGFNIAAIRSRIKPDSDGNKSENIINEFEAFYQIDSVDEFLEKIDFEPMELSESDLVNKALYLDIKEEGNCYIKFLDNGSYEYYEEDKEPESGTWRVEKNVLVLDDVTFAAIRRKEGSILYTTISEKGELFNETDALLKGDKVNNTDDILNIIDNKPKEIAEKDLKGTVWKLSDTDKLYLNDDYSVKVEWVEDGKTVSATGKWSMDNNIIVIDLDKNDFDVDKSYIIPLYTDEDSNGLFLIGLLSIDTDTDENINMVMKDEWKIDN